MCIDCIADVSEVLALPKFKSVIQLTLTSCLLLPPETRPTVSVPHDKRALFNKIPFWGMIFKTYAVEIYNDVDT